MMAESGENTHVYCLLPLINNDQISKLLGHSVWIKEEEKKWRRKKSFLAQSYTTHVWLHSILPLNWAYYMGRYKTTICTLEPIICSTSGTLALCKQENTLDIALDTSQILVSISKVRECVTQTLQIFQILRDPQTHVGPVFLLSNLILGKETILFSCIGDPGCKEIRLPILARVLLCLVRVGVTWVSWAIR